MDGWMGLEMEMEIEICICRVRCIGVNGALSCTHPFDYVV